MGPQRAAQLRAARLQSLAVLTVFTAVGALCTAAEIAAHDPELVRRIEEARRESSRKSGWPYYNRGFFRDWGERVLLEEMPGADYSRGGVYVMGTSTVVYATEFWRLPAEQRSRIHNYGFESSDHTRQFQVLRLLVERQNLLEAGGEKTLVIFGPSIYGITPEEGLKTYSEKLVTRQGLYRFNSVGDIEPVPVSPVSRLISVEKARITGVLLELLAGWPLRIAKDRFSIGRFRRLDCDWHQRIVHMRMSPQWESKMNAQLAEFDRMLDYLRIRNVMVVVVLWPVCPCDGDLPYVSAYNQEISNLCRAKEVRLLDWTGMLEEDDFADYIHTSVGGAEKVNQAVMELAGPFLQAIVPER